ncbi:DUF4942 domain-containing protein [Shewanella colwelliana]|uniref:DUF4942 domain-containing protein n=1 Tax=Shewanella colwelliana TaxID=23 RepID=UPI0022B039F0|nr:DUF4942 domain-containing protein [Shewanella colwelliana]MCZ4339753.1 DUF4942 domain-containing protein [Shewanella colwelliana]
MKQLIKPELIELLCHKRAQLLDSFEQQLTYLQLSHRHCAELDELIPAHPEARYQYLDIIFIQFRHLLGENARPLPKDVSILCESTDKLMAKFTHLLDCQLWEMLFNRLNIESMMSSKKIADFRQDLKENHQIFAQETIEATLVSLVNDRASMLIESLLDVMSGSDSGYASNSKRSFGRRTIFKQALVLQNGCYFKLNGHSRFKDTIEFLSRCLYAESVNRNESHQIVPTTIWQDLTDMFESPQEALDRPVYEFSAGRIEFFNNCCAHLYLDTTTVNWLNRQLSGTGALFDGNK